MTQVRKPRKRKRLNSRPLQRSKSKRHRIGFEQLEERLVLDALGFDLRTEKTDYKIGETVRWEAWVSLSDVEKDNFGIHTVSFDLAEDRSERMNSATIGPAFADYTIPGRGLAELGKLRSAGAGQFGYNAAIVEVTAAEPGPTLLATGSYTLTLSGAHKLSLTPNAVSQFFATNSGFAGKAYSSLIGDTESFVVGGSSVPTVGLSVDNPAIPEAGGMATVSAWLSAVSDEDVTVDLGFSGTATKSIDYRPQSTQILIAAGRLSGTARITAVQDLWVEPNETIVVDITNVSNARESETQQLTVHIVDDDSFPSVDTLSFDLQTDKTDYVVGETVRWEAWVSLSNVGKNNFGIHTVSFDLAEDRPERMTPATIGPEFADYSITSQGFAEPGGLRKAGAGQFGYDSAIVEVTAAEPGPTLLATGSYTLTLSGAHELSLTPDVSSQFFAVNSGFAGKAYNSLIGDTESFVVGGSSARSVRLSVDNPAIPEAGGVATVSAWLSAVSDQDVTVDLGFSGTATKSIDYRPQSTQILIAAGRLSGTVRITAVQDRWVEPNETIVVDITGLPIHPAAVDLCRTLGHDVPWIHRW